MTGQRTWWVTRPEPDASAWAKRLTAAGVRAQALPLLAIGPAPDVSRLHEAAAQLKAGHWQAAMFVSVNAARGLLCECPDVAAAFGATLRAWTVGPGSADMLRHLGIAPSAIDMPSMSARQFESEALWTQVAGQVRRGYRVLFLRGADATGVAAGRDWLSQQLHAAGAEVANVATYTRLSPPELPARLQAMPEGGGWVMSSSQALAELARAAPGQDWSSHVAVCTHERVAAAVQALGFGQIQVCRPAFEDVLASIESAA